jgi:hypothetical protein
VSPVAATKTLTVQRVQFLGVMTMAYRVHIKPVAARAVEESKKRQTDSQLVIGEIHNQNDNFK